METKIKRVYSPDKKYWFEIKDLGEIRMGWHGYEVTTSFDVDGTNFFSLAAGNAYFKDDNTFLIYDYGGLVIYFLNEKQAMHILRPEGDLSALSLDTHDPQNPILKIYGDDENPPKCLDVFKSLQLFSSGRGYF